MEPETDVAAIACPVCRKVPLLIHQPGAGHSRLRAQLILERGFCHCRCRHCGLFVGRGRDGQWLHLATDKSACRNATTVAEPSGPVRHLFPAAR